MMQNQDWYYEQMKDWATKQITDEFRAIEENQSRREKAQQSDEEYKLREERRRMILSRAREMNIAIYSL